MQSTFAGLEIAKRGLAAHNQALLTIGHNLTNASTEGYSRQRVEFSEMDPLYAPSLNREETPGQIGQGVVVSRIERVRDDLVHGRIVAETGLQGYWSTRDSYIAQLEKTVNEPSDSSVRTLMDKFWDSWQELSLRPGELPAREAVLSRGGALTEGIRDRYRRLSDLGSTLDGDIRGQARQVNDLAKRIAELNNEIQKSKALGDSPNDLMDQRDLLVEKLGTIVPVTVDQRDKDEFMIHIEGLILVQGKESRSFEMGKPDAEGYATPIWADTKQATAFKGGSLGALVELRDKDLREAVNSLDTMALSFSDLVNETHRAGYGSNGKTGLDFFKEWPFINNLAGNYDANGDGAYDSTWLYRMTGGNSLSAQEQVGLRGSITLSGPAAPIEIQYFPTDTVADVVGRINSSGAEVTARLDRDGRLQLRATPAADRGNPSFVIRHVEDSGQFLGGYAGILKGSGPASAFDWAKADAVNSLRVATAGADGGKGLEYATAPLSHPSGWLDVAAYIKSDPGNIAAGFGKNGKSADAGDGSAALAIGKLRTEPVMVGSLRTFDDHFAEEVARIGLKGEEAGRAAESHARIGKELHDLQSSLSGVNMDEELANMIKFQHGYAAAAKFATVIDQMLQTIINKLGA